MLESAETVFEITENNFSLFNTSRLNHGRDKHNSQLELTNEIVLLISREFLLEESKINIFPGGKHENSRIDYETQNRSILQVVKNNTL